MSFAEELALLKEAMVRIGRSPDGRTFYLHLQKSLMAVDTIPQDRDAAGALREIQGRRLLLQQLRDWLAPGVKETEANLDERPIILHRPEPVRLVDDTRRSPARRGGGSYGPGSRGAAE
jgi:hypothetical protein